MVIAIMQATSDRLQPVFRLMTDFRQTSDRLQTSNSYFRLWTSARLRTSDFGLLFTLHTFEFQTSDLRLRTQTSKFRHQNSTKIATKIQNGREMSTPKYFVGAKTLKVRDYSNFTTCITFLTIWRCAGDFFKVLLKFKMAATNQLQFFCGRKNCLSCFDFGPRPDFEHQTSDFGLLTFTLHTFEFHTLLLRLQTDFKLQTSEFYQNCYQNSKWPPDVNSKIFCGRKNSKVGNYSNFTTCITFLTIWRCAGDFFKVLLKFKMAATDQR